MDFLKVTYIVRRYLWLFAVATLVASLTTYFTLNSKPVMYETKTRLLVGPSMDSPSPDLNSLKIGGQLIQTYAELISSRPFLEMVNTKLEQKTDLESLGGMIEIKQNPDTRILTIFVRHRDPKQAVAIANATATTLIEMSPAKDNTTTLLRAQMSNQSPKLEQIITNSEAAIEELEAKLIALGNVSLPTLEAAQANLEQQKLVISQLSEERARLSDALRTLSTIYGMMRDTNTNQVEVIEPASAVFLVSQNLLLRVAASGIAGLILAVSIIFFLEYYGDAIRFPGDFNRVANVPLLSTIEKHKRLEGNGFERVITLAQPDSRASNNYRAAVAKLLFSIGDSLPHTLLISSVGSRSGEDTADIVANLGVAFAQAGKRVVLVDAQFHNPLLSELFESNEEPGLAEFMSANTPKMKLTQLKGVKDMRLLPAGLSTEKSSGAVLNSTKITKLIEGLQKDADIVLIAGSPFSWFAENLSLATHVNGVILVARLGEAHNKVVNEVVESLRAMNVYLAGLIFDNNQPPFAFKIKPRNVFENPQVTPEDSHV